MKLVFTLLISCGTLLMQAQHSPKQGWIELHQDPIHIKYEIPRNWYIGGYMGPKACKCTGAALNTSPRGSINMLIFNSNEYGIDSLKRQEVWGYNFIETESLGTITTEHVVFEQTISRWAEDSTLNVLRLTLSDEKDNYLIYFWGEEDAFDKNKEVIEYITMNMRFMR